MATTWEIRLVAIDNGIDEAAPLLKFSTETDKRDAVADLAALVKVGALTPDAELEAYLRAEGDLPELVDDDALEADEEDEPTPIRPAARGRIKAKALMARSGAATYARARAKSSRTARQGG